MGEIFFEELVQTNRAFMNLHQKVDIGLGEISYIPIGASSNNSLD